MEVHAFSECFLCDNVYIFHFTKTLWTNVRALLVSFLFSLCLYRYSLYTLTENLPDYFNVNFSSEEAESEYWSKTGSNRFTIKTAISIRELNETWIIVLYFFLGSRRVRCSFMLILMLYCILFFFFFFFWINIVRYIKKIAVVHKYSTYFQIYEE